MLQEGIGINLHYIPVYRQPYYEKMGFVAGYCPVAEEYYRSALSILSFRLLVKAGNLGLLKFLSEILCKS